MSLNKDLHRANRQKNDDFYTQLTDIEKELKHYRHHFSGKVVYCNCDDPTISNFYKYFSLNFQTLSLKRLIATCYRNGQHDMFSNRKDESAVWLEFASNVTNRRVGYIPSEPIVRNLEGDGDFRSDECIDLMKRAEIVVTNPPFSLFREYVAQLIEHKKKFLILGSQNAITYKEIFPLIKNKKMWLGLDNGGTKWFEVKPHYTIKTQSRQKEENGKKYFSMGNITWFTNLDHSKRHEKLILYKRYSPEEYQKYDNYDAIEVSRIESIPTDYAGAMGVPITFLDKHNPNQFELLGATESEGKGFSNGLWFPDSGVAQPVIRGKRVYKRLFIRNRRPQS